MISVNVQEKIIDELRLLQRQTFEYGVFQPCGKGPTHRKSTQSDSALQSSHLRTDAVSNSDGISYPPERSLPIARQWLMSDRPISNEQLLASLDDFTHQGDATDTPTYTEADEVQNLLRRDSSQSGQSPMSSAHFDRCSRVSDRSLPRTRQHVSIDDRRECTQTHVHSHFHDQFPRRAMVRDAADRGRPSQSKMH